MLTERRIQIDDETWNRVLEKLPDVSIHAVVNELLFHFAAALTEDKFTLSPFYLESAERTQQSFRKEEE